MSFFTSAHDFSIHSATIQNAQTINVHNNTHPPSQNPIEILDRARAVEATHRSATAELAPKCNPRTRKQVLNDLIEWISASGSPRRSILLFDGPAGAGKTCIMREIASQCEQQGIQVLSYFFSTRGIGLDTERPFIATIAHQLATTSPQLSKPIAEAVARNPTILREGLQAQLQSLILKPVSDSSYAGRILVVVDGLDECREEGRVHVLHILLSLTTHLPHQVLVVVASRPELDIHTAFELPVFRSVAQIIHLHDYDGSEDVRQFYRAEFSKIRTSHHLRRYIPSNWPDEASLEVLIHNSSGNFIYPATIIKYLTDHPRRSPVHLLQGVLTTATTQAGPENPLAQLDSLYTLILHPPDADFDLMKTLLHTILATTRAHIAGSWLSDPGVLDQFFHLEPGTVESTLCDLHSILYIPQTSTEASFASSRSSNPRITFHHKTLQDFLLTPWRSKDLFQPLRATYLDLALRCTLHIVSWADKSYPTPTFDLVTAFSCAHWFNLLANSLDQSDRDTSLPDVPEGLLNFHPKWIWTFTLIHRVPTVKLGLDPARDRVHQSLCAGRASCILLCTRLSQMSEIVQNRKAVREFAGLDPDASEYQSHLGALHNPLKVSTSGTSTSVIGRRPIFKLKPGYSRERVVPDLTEEPLEATISFAHTPQSDCPLSPAPIPSHGQTSERLVDRDGARADVGIEGVRQQNLAQLLTGALLARTGWYVLALLVVFIAASVRVIISS